MLDQLLLSVIVDGVDELVALVDDLCVDLLDFGVSLGSHQLAKVSLVPLQAVSVHDEVAMLLWVLAMNDHLKEGVADAVLGANVDCLLFRHVLHRLEVEPCHLDGVAYMVALWQDEFPCLLPAVHPVHDLLCRFLLHPLEGGCVL